MTLIELLDTLIAALKRDNSNYKAVVKEFRGMCRDAGMHGSVIAAMVNTIDENGDLKRFDFDEGEFRAIDGTGFCLKIVENQ